MHNNLRVGKTILTQNRVTQIGITRNDLHTGQDRPGANRVTQIGDQSNEMDGANAETKGKEGRVIEKDR